MRALGLGCALLVAAFVDSAVAQQCTTLDGTSINVGNFAGNTCGKNLTLTSLCGGGDVTNGAGTSVVQVNNGNNPVLNFSVSSTTTNFNPELAYTNGACSSLSACQIDDTNGTQVVPSSGTDQPSQQPASFSTSFVFISDLNAESPGCGDYTLTIGGVYPVKLQDFSVD